VEGLRKTTKNLILDRRSLGRDSNPGPSEHNVIYSESLTRTGLETSELILPLLNIRITVKMKTQKGHNTVAKTLNES
jgi:hypothetical protein